MKKNALQKPIAWHNGRKRRKSKDGSRGKKRRKRKGKKKKAVEAVAAALENSLFGPARHNGGRTPINQICSGSFCTFLRFRLYSLSLSPSFLTCRARKKKHGSLSAEIFCGPFWYPQCPFLKSSCNEGVFLSKDQHALRPNFDGWSFSNLEIVT